MTLVHDGHPLPSINFSEPLLTVGAVAELPVLRQSGREEFAAAADPHRELGAARHGAAGAHHALAEGGGGRSSARESIGR